MAITKIYNNPIINKDIVTPVAQSTTQTIAGQTVVTRVDRCAANTIKPITNKPITVVAAKPPKPCTYVFKTLHTATVVASVASIQYRNEETSKKEKDEENVKEGPFGLSEKTLKFVGTLSISDQVNLFMILNKIQDLDIDGDLQKND